MYGSPSSSLRVPITSRLTRIDPPIPIPPSLLSNESTLMDSLRNIDTSLEQRVVSEARDEKASLASSSHASDSGILALMAMGFNRAHASLACAFSPPGQGGRVTEAAVTFAEGLKTLSEMGHPLRLASGALLRSNCDVNKAAETLLASR